MSKINPYLSLSQTLSRLMSDKGLKQSDLVELTGLPQTTISNILRGKSKHPRADTLKIIAKVFEIDIDQLVEHEDLKGAMSVISADSLKSQKVQKSFLFPATVPLMLWEEVRPWIMGQGGIRAYATWLPNNICKSQKSFALKAKASMHSYFLPHKQVGSVHAATLLIDPDSSVDDGKVILVFLDESKEPCLRLLTIEGEEKWLEPLEKGRASVALNQNHSVIGPVVEVRYTPGS